MAEENLERLTKTAKVNSKRVEEVNSAKGAKSLFQLQRQLAGTARVQWVQDAATTRIQFAEDITEAWAKAARELLR